MAAVLIGPTTKTTTNIRLVYCYYVRFVSICRVLTILICYFVVKYTSGRVVVTSSVSEIDNDS
jgi:hypothetical protein